MAECNKPPFDALSGDGSACAAEIGFSSRQLVYLLAARKPHSAWIYGESNFRFRCCRTPKCGEKSMTTASFSGCGTATRQRVVQCPWRVVPVNLEEAGPSRRAPQVGEIQVRKRLQALGYAH